MTQQYLSLGDAADRLPFVSCIVNGEEAKKLGEAIARGDKETSDKMLLEILNRTVAERKEGK